MARSTEKSAEAFRTISEVAEEVDVPQHVLRFWETKFAQIKPLKRGGGRRYYRPEDIDLIRSIRGWLYDDGYTIKGVQKLLREGAASAALAEDSEPDEPHPGPTGPEAVDRAASEPGDDGRASADRVEPLEPDFGGDPLASEAEPRPAAASADRSHSGSNAPLGSAPEPRPKSAPDRPETPASGAAAGAEPVGGDPGRRPTPGGAASRATAIERAIRELEAIRDRLRDGSP